MLPSLQLWSIPSACDPMRGKITTMAEGRLRGRTVRPSGGKRASDFQQLTAPARRGLFSTRLSLEFGGTLGESREGTGSCSWTLEYGPPFVETTTPIVLRVWTTIVRHPVLASARARARTASPLCRPCERGTHNHQFGILVRRGGRRLEHDPEKCAAVFGKDHV
jgi:hypothetical protein